MKLLFTKGGGGGGGETAIHKVVNRESSKIYQENAETLTLSFPCGFIEQPLLFMSFLKFTSLVEARLNHDLKKMQLKKILKKFFSRFIMLLGMLTTLNRRCIFNNSPTLSTSQQTYCRLFKIM